MKFRFLTLVLAVSSAAFGQVALVNYAANLNVGDSIINIQNPGTATVAGVAANVCANVYAFSPDEQLVSCCSCTITPNGQATLSAINDLINNTLTPARPTAITTKIISSVGVPCNAAAVPAASVVSGLVASETHLHLTPAPPYNTETNFTTVGESASDLARITSFCGFIQANGSGFGICRSCTMGGAGAVKN